MDDVYYRLIKLRKSYNYTKKELSEYLDCSEEHISKIEQGIIELTETELEKLSALYNCSIKYILEGKEEYTSILPDNYLDINNLDRTTVKKMGKIIRKTDSSPKMPREIGE